MKRTILFVFSVFPAIAHASDPSALIPYAIGFLAIICVAVCILTWFVTRSLPNSWQRFYIRVLSLPIVLALLFLILGLEWVSIILIVVTVLYIVLYRAVCKWFV